MTAESSTETNDVTIEVAFHEEAHDAPTVPADENDPATLSLTIFTKNDCPKCRNTEGQFDRKGVPFTEINVEEDTEPREEFGGLTPMEHVIAKYGREMPVVVVSDNTWGDHWTGLRIDKMIEVVRRFDDAGLIIPEELREAAIRGRSGASA